MVLILDNNKFLVELGKLYTIEGVNCIWLQTKRIKDNNNEAYCIIRANRSGGNKLIIGKRIIPKKISTKVNKGSYNEFQKQLSSLLRLHLKILLYNMKKNRSKAAHHAFLQRLDAEYREKLAKKADKRRNNKINNMDIDNNNNKDNDIDVIDNTIKNRRPLSTRDKMAKKRRERRDRLKIKVIHKGDDSKMKNNKNNKRKALVIKKDIIKASIRK